MESCASEQPFFGKLRKGNTYSVDLIKQMITYLARACMYLNAELAFHVFAPSFWIFASIFLYLFGANWRHFPNNC